MAMEAKLELLLTQWLLGLTSGAAFAFNYHEAIDDNDEEEGQDGNIEVESGKWDTDN